LKIALAGGTSLLARDLISSLEVMGHDVFVFSREPKSENTLEYSKLSSSNFNLIVNMSGGHRTSAELGYVGSILRLGEFMAEVALEQDAHLIHLSSGSCLRPDSILTSSTPLASPPYRSPYQEAKVSLETLHRTLRAKQPIADLRIFSFADKFFLRDSTYLLGAILESKKAGRQFEFSGDEFIRDYIGGRELASAIISACEDLHSGAFNLFSSQPVHSGELVDLLIEAWGCDIAYGEESRRSCKAYFAEPESLLRNYTPRSSLEVISEAFRLNSSELWS